MQSWTRTLRCDVCGRSFLNTEQLEEHMSTHVEKNTKEVTVKTVVEAEGDTRGGVDSTSDDSKSENVELNKRYCIKLTQDAQQTLSAEEQANLIIFPNDFIFVTE